MSWRQHHARASYSGRPSLSRPTVFAPPEPPEPPEPPDRTCRSGPTLQTSDPSDTPMPLPNTPSRTCLLSTALRIRFRAERM